MLKSLASASKKRSRSAPSSGGDCARRRAACRPRGSGRTLACACSSAASREGQRLAVVAGDQVHDDRLRRRTASMHLVQQRDVADRLGHLLARELDHAVVHPQLGQLRARAPRASARPRSRGAGTRGPSRRRGCRSRRRAAARPSPSTRCASRGALAPRATPRRCPRPPCAPSTARSPADPPCAAAPSHVLALVHVVRAAVREAAVAVVGAHAEVHVAVGRVGVAAVDQRGDVLDDRPDRLRGERLVVGAAEAERVGVGAIQRGHLGGQLGARAALRARGVVDLVVDVGHVDDERRLRSPRATRKRLSRLNTHERPRVADVDAAVDGRSARVDADAIGVGGRQRQQLAAARVVQAYLAHRAATLARRSRSIRPLRSPPGSPPAGWRRRARRRPRRARRSRCPRRCSP